jgi:EAL and modified HD-GYP domain-containing signal transduction protein
MNTELVLFHLLADRRGRPAALVLRPSAGLPPDALPAALTELPARLPCLLRGDVPEATAATLRQAGWQPLADTDVLRADAPFDDALPPGVRYVEGDWALAPPARPPGQQAASRALALQLVQLVNRDADTHEIEALLRRDPTLSYHLLRLVNSLGAAGGARKVTSFAQAILILGRQQLRRWLNLMLFAAREGDMRSAMLLARVSVRARLMELLARAAGLDRHHQEQAFMAGMFSLLGVLFGSPLREVLAPLALGPAVQQALLAGSGELGTLLALVQAAERGAGEELAAALGALQVDAAEFNALAAEAHLWMLGVIEDAAPRKTGTDNA